VTPVRRLMAVYLTLVGLVTVLYMAIPSLLTPLWALIGLGGVAAVLTGIRLHRPDHPWPWLALAAGLLAFTAGDTYYNIQEAYFDAENPFPSPADACYLAVYPLFAAGLFGLVRHRWADRDVPSLLDALIVTAGLALPVWVYLVRPLAVEEDLTWQQRIISIAYPLGDVLVLAMLLILLAPSPGHGRNRSIRLLFLGTATLLGIDITYGILQLNGNWQVGTLLDSGWIVFYTAWGLAALHPDMAGLTRPEARPQSVLPPARRLMLLAAATLIAPGLLLLEEEQGGVRDAAVLAVFTTVLVLLVILRLTGMVVAHRKALVREQALGTATASLVSAVDAKEIARSCEGAVNTLFGPDIPHRTMLLAAAPTQRLYWHLAEPGGTVPRDTVIVPTTRLDPALAAELGGLPTALVSPLGRPDHPGGTPSGALVAVGPERSLAEMRDSLDILVSHASLARDRIALRQEITRRQSEAYFRTLVSNASDVILIVDDDCAVRYASPSARAVFGRAELTGTPLRTLVDPRDRDRVDRTLASLCRHGRQESHDHWWVLRGGERIEVEVRCRDLRQDETIGGLVVTLRDVTEQRQLEHELTQRAFHDPLTGLPNRTLLLERTGRALLRGRRESVLTCLLFIDLDDFKIVNDTLGHSVGDHLLKAVSERLSESLRRSDTAARLGGDEFAVLMEDARQPLDAELLAAQVIQSLNRSFRLGETYVSVTASVGVATAQDSQDAEELLALADLALYAAKAAGKLQWRRFEPQLRVRMAERHDLRARLEDAIAREEFAVRYQPVVDITEGSGEDIVGFEALARWPHARRGLIPPGRFIPLAEETGHITPLGAWVLRSATTDMARLQQSAGRAVPPYVSVNVSGRQWREPGFLDEVCRALDTPGLAPGSLQLELTESVLMQRDEEMDRLIRELKGLGVRIAVDDFGTGFSSLRYLREFPLDVLKIDKSFIDDIPGDPRQVALVEGIVHMADTIGLQVIAEGIEEPAQRDLLTSMGCRFGQGYLFARPMTAEQGETALLNEGNGERSRGHGVPAVHRPAGTRPVNGRPAGHRREGSGQEVFRPADCGPEPARLKAARLRADTPEKTWPEADGARVAGPVEGDREPGPPEDDGALTAVAGQRLARLDRTGLLAPLHARAEGGLPDGDRPAESAAAAPRPGPLPHTRRPQAGPALERLRLISPMSDAVLDEVRGRHIRCGDHWLIDFASCNYLGLDWDPEVIAAVEPAVRRWGTHPSWSRLLGSPKLYPDIEERLTELLGAEDTLLLPTITLIHAAVIPVLAGDGHVFVDATAHKTVYDGCVAARGQGATLHRCHAGRPDQLDAQLRDTPAGGPRLVCLDGVDSMTGNVPDLPALAEVCRRHGATLYVDDAHGFGVIGQRGPDEPCRYGLRGNSVVRHTGESYDGIVLVGGFSKAYSSLLAFLALPTALKNRLKTAAGPYLYSGPSPTASLATTMAGLDVNDRRGDAIRAVLHRRTMRLLGHVHRLNLDVPCHDELPIVEVPLADPGDLDTVGAVLWEHGIYVTLAAHPLVPRDRVGFRVQVTALNSDADIDRLCDTLTVLDERGTLRHRG
jgi:diguanylate cyclase (GGDEF)-like protein/PAS domain S-box-containing protein